MALMNCASGCVPPLSWLTEVRTNTPVAGMDPVKPHSSWLQREKESIGLFPQIRVFLQVCFHMDVSLFTYGIGPVRSHTSCTARESVSLLAWIYVSFGRTKKYYIYISLFR